MGIFLMYICNIALVLLFKIVVSVSEASAYSYDILNFWRFFGVDILIKFILIKKA